MYFFTRPFFFILFLFCGFSASAQLNANFTADNTQGCAPLVVHFTNTSTGATSYSWDLGNGTTSAQQNVSGSYVTAGTYTVTLTAYAASGSSSVKTMVITVFQAPTVNFSANITAGCAPLSVSFTDLSNPGIPGTATYLWDFGDGQTSNAENPTHIFAAPGFYNITLVVTNSQGCVSSFVQNAYIDVYTPPGIAISANNQNFCGVPAHVIFSNSTTGVSPITYYWQFGDGGTSNQAAPTHDYNATGTYTVRISATDAHGCTDSAVYTAYIHVATISADFTGPATACVFTPVTFNGTSTPAATSIFWYFGDGATASVDTPTHIYSTPGTYNVTMIVSNGACLDTVVKPITILPEANGSFTFAPPISCPPPTTVQFNSAGQNITSYSWTFGDGGTSFLGNPTHTYASAGIDTITFIATNANGCKDTVREMDTLYDALLTITATPDSGCIPLPVQFTMSLLTSIPPPGPNGYPSPISTYLWNFGDGSATSNLSSPLHTYTVSGVYTVTLTVTTANGCTMNANIIVSAGTPPTAAFTAAPTHICADRIVSFTNNSIGATSYLWTFGDSATSNQINPVHTYSLPGVFTVTLVAYDHGCTDTLVMPYLITVDSPEARILYSYICNPATEVAFVNNSIGATSFIWSFGDGTTSLLDTVTHNYPALGTYTVQLATYNSRSGCRDTATDVLHLLQAQVAFTANDTAVCRDQPVHFTASATGDTIVGYQWYVNNAFIDTGTNFIDTFHATGIYTVAVVAEDAHNCSYTVTKNNYIIVAKPVDSFSAMPPSGCLPLNVLFSDHSTDVPGTTFTSWQWSFGDGAGATVYTPNTSHIYTVVGTFSVQEIVTDNIGCKDTLTKPNLVYTHKPTASFLTSNTHPCRYSPVLFTNTSTGAQLTYFWNFGDGDTSSSFSPTHYYQQYGTYTVTLIVTDSSGCTDTMKLNNYISVSGPVASFTMSDSVSICPPLQVHFTNTSTGAYIYSWDFGNGNTSNQINPSATYVAAGNYTVTLIAKNNYNCADTATRNIIIYGYAGAFTYLPLIGCAPLTVNFNANLTNIPSITWDFADGNTVTLSSSNTISHVYTVPGEYVPKLILSDNSGCQSSSVGADTIKVDTVYPGYITSPACIYDSVHFLDTSKSLFSFITGWHWAFDNGDTSAINDPTHYYGATGQYQVVLNVTDGIGCTSSLTNTVTIHPLPIISAGPDTTICVGDAATLRPSGGVSYTWSPPASLSCTACTNPLANPTVVTTYVVIGTDTYGCVNDDSMTVSLKTKTTSVGYGGVICYGDTIILVDSGAQNYSWYPPNGLNNPNIGNPIASPTVTTTYTVITRDGSCIPDTNYITLVVHPLPTVDAGRDQHTVAGTPVNLNATGSLIAHYLWSPANSLDCDSCADPVAAPHQTTTYTVSVTSSFGCKDSDDVVVYVTCDNNQLFIPNSFTPNGDGQNDIFYPRGKGVSIVKSLRIYNRWGELLFERDNFNLNDASSGWDGSYHGGGPKPDVYVYIMDAVCDTGEPMTIKGDVTIIR